MIRKAALALLCLALTAVSANAALLGSFRQTATGQTTNALVYNGSFDTWVYEVRTTDAKNYDALSLNFLSATGAMLTTGSTTFKNTGASNPIVFGFNAPDCFIVLPDGSTQLAATQVDTANILQSDYTTQGALVLVPASGAKAIVAAFSVPAGTTVNSDPSVLTGGVRFAGGSGVSNQGTPVAVTNDAVPEPATFTLLGLALVGGLGYIRRR